MSHKKPRYDDATDNALVAEFQAQPDSSDGRNAAEALLCRYQKAAYLWCFRYVRDHDRALDLAQDVLLQAYQSLPNFRGDSEFSSWLFAVARNRCLNALRRGNAMVELHLIEDALADSTPTPDRELEDDEAETRLLALIEEVLDTTEQRAIWLRCVERVPVDEITARLDIVGASGARGVLQSARRKLRAARSRQRGRDEGERQ